MVVVVPTTVENTVVVLKVTPAQANSWTILEAKVELRPATANA